MIEVDLSLSGAHIGGFAEERGRADKGPVFVSSKSTPRRFFTQSRSFLSNFGLLGLLSVVFSVFGMISVLVVNRLCLLAIVSKL